MYVYSSEVISVLSIMATVRFFSIAFLMVLSPPEGIVVNCDSDNCDMSGNGECSMCIAT